MVKRAGAITGQTEMDPRVYAQVVQLVDEARRTSNLELPEDTESAFSSVALAFLDALIEHNNIAEAFRHVFPGTSDRKNRCAKSEGCRVLELVRAGFPSIRDYVRTIVTRAGATPAWIVNNVKDIAENAEGSQRLAALKYLAQLSEMGSQEFSIAAFMALMQNPTPRAVKEVVGREIKRVKNTASVGHKRVGPDADLDDEGREKRSSGQPVSQPGG